MRNVKNCVDAFFPLLNIEYVIVLGRKGVSVTLRIIFDKKDCFHLMGLQYLEDRPEINRDRGKIFDEILEGKLPVEKIESSDFYKKIEQRVHFLPLLENLLDDNNTVFKYNRKTNAYSVIEADYLMKHNAENRNLYLFLSKNREDTYYCRSFFPEEKRIILKIRRRGLCCIRKK